MQAKRLTRPNLVIDTRCLSPIQSAQISELRQRLSLQLKMLSKYRRTVIELHFGLRDGYSYNEYDVALIMRCSPSRARAVINTSISLLRNKTSSKALSAFNQ
jgi:DNA-directed RNA polymerase sigma subunit (sigma70/sigma32)